MVRHETLNLGCEGSNPSFPAKCMVSDTQLLCGIKIGFYSQSQQEDLKMIELFKSEKTGKIYESKKDLEADEKKYDEKQAQIEDFKKKRAERAKEVETLEAAYLEARKKYQDALNSFIQDYKSYHHTQTSVTTSKGPTLSELFATFFNLPF